MLNMKVSEEQGFFGVFRFSGSALKLVWLTRPSLVIWLALLTVMAGVFASVYCLRGSAYCGFSRRSYGARFS